MKHLGRKLLLPVAAVALAGGSFAFLASNNVDASHAGEGTGAIGGYHVSNIHYTFDRTGNTPTQNAIHDVTFTLDNSATDVTAVIASPGSGGGYPPNVGGYYDYANCAPQNADSTVWKCTYGGSGKNDGTADEGQAPMLQTTSLTVNAAS